MKLCHISRFGLKAWDRRRLGFGLCLLFAIFLNSAVLAAGPGDGKFTFYDAGIPEVEQDEDEADPSDDPFDQTWYFAPVVVSSPAQDPAPVEPDPALIPVGHSLGVTPQEISVSLTADEQSLSVNLSAPLLESAKGVTVPSTASGLQVIMLPGFDNPLQGPVTTPASQKVTDLSPTLESFAPTDLLESATLEPSVSQNTAEPSVQALSIPSGSARLIISEIQLSNVDTIFDADGDSSDWVEVCNVGSASTGLSGYYLSDDPQKRTKWAFPDATLAAGACRIVFASDKNRASGNEWHTNFKLSTDDQFVVLTDFLQRIIDQVDISHVPRRLSAGRDQDSAEMVVFSSPTPGTRNTLAAFTPPPQFSVKSGYFQGSFSVAISPDSPDTEIHYTRDGSTPSMSSPLYTGPLTVNETTTIKAIAFQSGHFVPSPVTGESYIFKSKAGLPMVAVTTDEANLWDPYEGIFVADGDAPDVPQILQRKERRQAFVTVLTSSGEEQFSQAVEISVAGNSSRLQSPRPFRLRTSFEEDPMHQELDVSGLFGQKAALRSFVIRNEGQDGVRLQDVFDGTIYQGVTFDPFLKPTLGLRNSLMAHLCRDLNTIAIHQMVFRDVAVPVHVMVNGITFGIGTMTQHRDKQTLAAQNPQYDDDDIDELVVRGGEFEQPLARFDNTMITVDYHGRAVIEYEEVSRDAQRKGGRTGLEDLLTALQFIETQDMSDEGNYETARQYLVPETVITAMVSRIIAGDVDTGDFNNVAYWRNDPLEGPPGPFHWYAFDFDTSFGITDDVRDHDTLAFMLENNVVLKSLLRNSGFRNAFIHAFDIALNGPFSADHAAAVAQELKSMMEPYVEEHLNLWAAGLVSYADWQRNVNDLIAFVRGRPARIRSLVASRFGLSGRSVISFTAIPEQGGHMEVEGLRPDAGFAQGTFFNDVPWQAAAKAAPGFRFIGWLENGRLDPTVSRTIRPSGNMELAALFLEDPTAPVADVVINEVVTGGSLKESDEDGEDQDWIELFNTTAFPVDLKGYFLSDDADEINKWELPGVTLPPRGYLRIFASGKDRKNSPERLHTNFGLSDDPVILSDSRKIIVDQIPVRWIRGIISDHSGGRFPDGSGIFQPMIHATPGAPNIF